MTRRILLKYILVIITLILISCWMTAFADTVIYDECEDLSVAIAHSEGIYADVISEDSQYAFEDDYTMFMRSEVTPEWVEYEIPQNGYMIFNTYFRQGNVDDFVIEISVDGSVWKKFVPIINKRNIGADKWIPVSYSLKYVPETAKYVKITFADLNGVAWSPCIASVEVRYSALDNSGFIDCIDTPYDDSTALLKNLNLVNGYNGIEFKPYDNITRAEFCEMVSSVLNLDKSNNKQGVFPDVASDYWANASINSVYSLGVINGDENGFFNPDNNITLAEGVKIITSILGYSEISKLQGGYPSGYIISANKLRLLDKVNETDTNKAICRGDAAELFAAALDAELLSQKAWGGDNIYTYGGTLLSEYLNIEKTKGIVTSCGIRSITADSAGSNKIMIDSDLYFCDDKNAGKLLGMNAEVYVKNERNNEKTVTYARALNNEVREIEYGDYLRKQDNLLYYLKDNMKSEKYINTNENTRVVYNGKYKSRLGVIDKLPLNCGNFTAIDNNMDNIIDVVIIEDYKTYYTEIESRFGAPVSDKYLGVVRLNLEQAEEVEIVRDGEREVYSPDSTFLANQAICAAISEDGSLARIVICDEYISGKIEYVNKEEGLCRINGREINTSNYFIESGQKIEATNDAVTVKLDVNGRIVYIDDLYVSGEYAYLRAVGDRDILDGSVSISLIMQSGTAKTYKVTGKTSVNGSKSAVDSALTFEPQLVKIKLRSDDTLASIDTASENNSEPSADNFTLDHSSDSSAWRAAGLNVFDAVYKLDSSTKIFMIPEDMTNISEYKVSGISDLYADFKYNIKIYDLSSDYIASAVVVNSAGSERRTAATYDPVCIVDKVAEYIDEEGNNCFKILGYVNGEYTEVRFDKDGAVDDTSWWSDYQKRDTSYGKNPFVRGEIFQYYSDADGVCKSIKMLLTSELMNCENIGFEHKIGDYEPLSESAYYSELYFALGKVKNKFADRIFICPNDELGWLRTIPLTGTNVVILDTSRNKLRLGDSADIYSGAEIFARMYFGTCKEILVIE